MPFQKGNKLAAGRQRSRVATFRIKDIEDCTEVALAAINDPTIPLLDRGKLATQLAKVMAEYCFSKPPQRTEVTGSMAFKDFERIIVG